MRATRISKRWKPLSPSPKRVEVELRRGDAISRANQAHHGAVVRDDLALPGARPRWLCAATVGSNDPRLVLDRARDKQRSPMVRPACGPAGADREKFCTG
jgi:hypothetical protein